MLKCINLKYIILIIAVLIIFVFAVKPSIMSRRFKTESPVICESPNWCELVKNAQIDR